MLSKYIMLTETVKALPLDTDIKTGILIGIVIIVVSAIFMRLLTERFYGQLCRAEVQ